MTDPGSTPPPVPPGALASSPLGQSPPEAVASGGDDRLATAFTRIVGEQLNEQREISALLSDLRARLNSLDGLTQEMDLSVARRVSAVATEVREFIERRGDPEDARREAEAAREQIVAARSQVYELSSSLGASIEGIEAELAGLAPAVSGLGPLLATMGPRIEELHEDVTTLTGGVTSLTDGMSSLQSDVSSLNGDLTVMGGDVTSLNGGVTSITDGVTSLHDGVSSLSEGVTSLNDGVTSLNDSVRSLQGSVSELPGQGSLDELSDGMAGMRTDLRSLPEQVGGAVGGRVAESLDQIRDSVHAVVAELATLQAAVSETPEPDPLMTELEAQLAGVASRVAALGELPEQLEGLATDLGAVWQAVQVLDDKLGALPIDEDLVPSVAAVGAAVSALEAGVRDLDARFEGFVASNDVGPDPELAEVSDSVVAVGVTLAEMRTTLEGVSGRLDELAHRPVDDSALRQLALDVAALETNLTAIGSNVAAVESKLASAEDIEVGPVLDGLAAALAGVAVGVDDLDAKLEERLDALTLALPTPPAPDARLDTVGASLQDVQVRLEGLGTELAAAVDALTSRVDGVQGRIEEVHGRVDEVHAQTVPVPDPAPAEDPSLAPLADLSDSVSVVSTGVAALSVTLVGLGEDMVTLDTRLGQLEAAAQQGPVPLSSADLTVITGHLTGEVAGLRGDLDNVRRLLLEDLPDDTIDPAQLAADIDATLSQTVGTRVSEQVSQHVAGVLETVLAEAVQRAVAETVNEAVNAAVSAAVSAAVGEAVAQSVDDAVTRVLQTSVEDAVRITVSPSIAQAIDAAVDRAAGQQVELESRLRAHVDEAVLALAEIVLNTPNLVISHAGAVPRPQPPSLTDDLLTGDRPAEPGPEPHVQPAVDVDEKKRRFGRK